MLRSDFHALVLTQELRSLLFRIISSLPIKPRDLLQWRTSLHIKYLRAYFCRKFKLSKSSFDETYVLHPTSTNLRLPSKKTWFFRRSFSRLFLQHRQLLIPIRFSTSWYLLFFTATNHQNTRLGSNQNSKQCLLSSSNSPFLWAQSCLDFFWCRLPNSKRKFVQCMNKHQQ